MGHIDLPGGMRVQPPDATAVQIIRVLAPLLQGTSNQLDLLIRLEVGAIDREELKTRILAADAVAQAQAAAAGNGQTP